MKRLISIVPVILILMTSLANGNEIPGEPYTVTNLYAIQHQTATQNAPDRAKSKKIIKSKVVNLRVHRFIAIDDDTDVYVQEEDLATGYRRRDLTKIEHPDDISEKVRWRLFLARQLALLKYREIHG